MLPQENWQKAHNSQQANHREKLDRTQKERLALDTCLKLASHISSVS